MTENLSDGHKLFAFVRKPRRTTVAKIPLVKTVVVEKVCWTRILIAFQNIYEAASEVNSF